MSSFILKIFYECVLLGLGFVFSKHALQMFQQNRYELYRYSKWLFNKNNLHFSYALIYCVAVLLIGTIFKNSTLIIIFISIGFAIYFIYNETKKWL